MIVMYMPDCPNFKLAWNGECAYLDGVYNEDDSHYIDYCKFRGEQIKCIKECEMYA